MPRNRQTGVTTSKAIKGFQNRDAGVPEGIEPCYQGRNPT